MPESPDLRPLLKAWPFDPEKHIRVAKGDDGREVMQVRTPLGIEQLELEGRPDGRRPAGHESFLDLQFGRLEEAKSRGLAGGFALNHDECEELFTEGTLYYFRYLHLFQARDWGRVVRDTARNLRLFDFVHHHATDEEDRNHLEKWRPYVLRMNSVALIMIEWEAGHHEAALKLAGKARQCLESLEELDDETFRFERGRSVEALHELMQQIEQTRPISERERLERKLKRAIEAQEFEQAAVLRDRLRALGAAP